MTTKLCPKCNKEMTLRMPPYGYLIYYECEKCGEDWGIDKVTLD